MTFPDTALGLDVELLVNSTWTSVKSYLDHPPVSIGRGHPDESVTVSQSTLALPLTNSDGRFSADNPTGPYYPWLVQNIPCRVSVPAQANYLRTEVDQSSGAACPDAAGLHISGDLDVRIDLRVTDFGPAQLIGNWNASSGKSWILSLTGAGTNQVSLSWSTDGSAVSFVRSTLPLPPGRLSLRATLAVASGTVTFYTGPAGNVDSNTGWTQFGGATVAGATSLHAGTNGIACGTQAGNTGFYGAAFEAEVRSGIGGTVAAHPVFSAQTAGATSFADAQGNTWTLSGTAEISSRDYRGYFELPEWPQDQPPYDPAGSTPDVTVAAVGGGLLRRLGQRSNPLNSPMYRAWARVTASILAAYWPMEDGASATQIASASGGQAMTFTGSPNLAASSDFACSAALPVINGAVLSGNVSYSGTWTDNQVAFLMEIPGGGEANGARICFVYTTGTVASLVLSYGTGGSIALTGYDSSGTQLFTTGAVVPFDGAVNGRKLLVEVGLQNAGGGNITWSMQTLAPGASSAGSNTGTVAGTVGAVGRVMLNPYGTLTSTVFGHCAVLATWQSIFTLDVYGNPYGLQTGALSAWAGEPAGHRFARICSEEGIPFRGRGDLGATVLMGAQTAQTLTSLLQECADADRGVWYELRQALGWGYITRGALYNQSATVELDFAQDHLGEWASHPTRDDQVIVNDVTVTQTSGGSSSRQYAATGQPITGGRLSTAAPGSGGVGTYDQDYSVNLYAAADLDSEASWIVHTGTIDRPRFPGLVMDLANRDLSAQFWAILDMDLGDRLTVGNPPVHWGPDQVSQLAQMLTESLGPFELTITMAGVPEQPYQVAAADSAHADTDGTTLSAGVTSGATSMSFATAGSNPLWTTSAGDFPFDVMIAGERVTVTNITGSSSPQTATVTRSVNGVVKAQSSGASVNVYPSPVAAL